MRVRVHIDRLTLARERPGAAPLQAAIARAVERELAAAGGESTSAAATGAVESAVRATLGEPSRGRQ